MYKACASGKRGRSYGKRDLLRGKRDLQRLAYLHGKRGLSILAYPEVCMSVKRDLFMRQKRPTYMAKENYY